MKVNSYGGLEYCMEPGKHISLGKYDTWVPLPDEIESILSQLQRVEQRDPLLEEGSVPLDGQKYQGCVLTD